MSYGTSLTEVFRQLGVYLAPNPPICQRARSRSN
jgi:hypothetical protein